MSVIPTTIPSVEEMMWPTVDALRLLGGSGTVGEIGVKVVALMGLSEEQQSLPHRAGRESEVEYRLAWARTYLKHIGAITASARGVWALTERGESINAPQVEQRTKVWKSEVAERRRQRRSGQASAVDGDTPIVEDVSTEDSVFEDWKDELTSRLLELSPGAFERLAQRLLREAEFINVTVTGRSGDGGIDGFGVYRMSLVSFPTAFQCKRWRQAVPVSAVRDFRGAMVGRAGKGLIITTGTFTRDATIEASRPGAPIVDLIDGGQLCDLLKEYGLGVSVEQRVVDDVTLDPGSLPS